MIYKHKYLLTQLMTNSTAGHNLNQRLIYYPHPLPHWYTQTTQSPPKIPYIDAGKNELKKKVSKLYDFLIMFTAAFLYLHVNFLRLNIFVSLQFFYCLVMFFFFVMHSMHIVNIRLVWGFFFYFCGFFILYG